MNWDIEAPNVVTEARFRELVESGYSAEILCQESAHKKGPSYYGVWIMRVVSDDGVEKLLVTARTRTSYNDIKIREFKTISGRTPTAPSRSPRLLWHGAKLCGQRERARPEGQDGSERWK